MNSQASSAAKGETLQDTIRVLENYVDAIVIRHPQMGSAKEASDCARVPIINAGLFFPSLFFLFYSILFYYLHFLLFIFIFIYY